MRRRGCPLFQADELGQKYVHLLKEEWSTHVTTNLSQGTTFTVDAFHGDYDITVEYQGKIIALEELQLGKSDMIYQMRIDGNGSKSK